MNGQPETNESVGPNPSRPSADAARGLTDYASPPSSDSEGVPTDHLSTYGRAVAVALIVVAVGLTVVSFLTGVSSGLPAIALDWGFGLHVIRAAEIFAIVAVVVMIIVRGWGGMWPSRVSTSGVEFTGVAEGSRDISYGVGMVLQVLPELVRLEVERTTTEGG